MNAQAIVTVSAAVLTLVQLLKWAKWVPDQYGPVAVLVISLAGVLFWIWTQGAFVRADGFGYFAAWVTVSLSASGAYGFSRAATAAQLTTTVPTPSEGHDGEKH